jgi:hypothetical protein
MTILITINTGDITYNDITFNQFYLSITLLSTENKTYKCKVTINNVISEVFISIFVLHTNIVAFLILRFFNLNENTFQSSLFCLTIRLRL